MQMLEREISLLVAFQECLVEEPEAKSRQVMTWIHKTFKRGWGPSNYKTDSWWHHTAAFFSGLWKISRELAGTRLGSSFKSPLNPIQVDVDIFKVGTSWTLVAVDDSKRRVLDSLASPGTIQTDSSICCSLSTNVHSVNCLDMRLGRHTTNQSNDACNAGSGATSLELSTARCVFRQCWTKDNHTCRGLWLLV